MRTVIPLLLCLCLAACARATTQAPAGEGSAQSPAAPGRAVLAWPDEQFIAPRPHEVVHVPGEGEELANRRHPLVVELIDLPEDFETIDFRRLPATNPERLSLEIRAANPFTVSAVEFGEWRGTVERAADRALYLDLPAFVGYYDIRIGSGDRWRELNVPASSIALDGPNLYLNGDEFLSKGGLMQWGNWEYDVRPTPETSFLLKNMGVNTVLIPPTEYYEHWGFTSIRKTVGIHMPKAAVQSAPLDSFVAIRDELVGRVPTIYPKYVSSPMDVASFFSNETTRRHDEEANAEGEIDEYARLNSYLARMHNAAKGVSPMMPTGYASHTPGFKPVPWLDLLMYNSYYYKDRYDEPLEKFAAFQGYPAKPLYHKEFSANTYLDQIYQGGGNNPAFSKIREWAFSQRWKDLMGIGSLGVGLFSTFDYKKGQESRDGNTTSFGFFTQHQEPKLLAHSVWNAFLDLRFRDGVLENRRDYPLRNLNLVILGDEEPRLLELDSLAAGDEVRLEIPDRFHWVAQFGTHGGLINQQMGAYPEALLRQTLASLLPRDESRSFMQHLLPTEIIGWDGESDRYLMDRFKNEDGVIAVAFERGPGEYYLTAWVQKNPNTGTRYETHTLSFFDVGEARLLDDVTGEPLDAELDYEVREGSLVFRDLELPRIGRSIRQRSEIPIKLPVIQVSKTGFAELTEASALSLTEPDQFQLWDAGSSRLGGDRSEALAQRFATRGDNLQSFIVKPLPDTGRPRGDVTARLHVAGADGLPAEKIAERAIAGDVWRLHADSLLQVDFGVDLSSDRDYVLVLSSPGDESNHRNVATAGFDATTVTPSYGAGELLFLRDGTWRSAAEGKESLFFITTSEREL